jgi:hypothetical protein
MGNHRALSIIVRFAFAITCLITFPPICIRAQQTTAPPSEMRDPFSEVRERTRREAQLRSAEMGQPVVRKNGRDTGIPLKQIADDFKQIQILRNNVVRHLLAEKPLDYKFIAGETVEINKRATRLAEHLENQSAEGEKKEERTPAEIADDQVKNALITMCKRIDSFTENPQFKNPDVFDLKEAEKARRDLREVVQLSSNIAKVSERLNKPKKK